MLKTRRSAMHLCKTALSKLKIDPPTTAVRVGPDSATSPTQSLKDERKASGDNDYSRLHPLSAPLSPDRLSVLTATNSRCGSDTPLLLFIENGSSESFRPLSATGDGSGRHPMHVAQQEGLSLNASPGLDEEDVFDDENEFVPPNSPPGTPPPTPADILSPTYLLLPGSSPYTRTQSLDTETPSPALSAWADGTWAKFRRYGPGTPVWNPTERSLAALEERAAMDGQSDETGDARPEPIRESMTVERQVQYQNAQDQDQPQTDTDMKHPPQFDTEKQGYRPTLRRHLTRLLYRPRAHSPQTMPPTSIPTISLTRTPSFRRLRRRRALPADTAIRGVYRPTPVSGSFSSSRTEIGDVMACGVGSDAEGERKGGAVRESVGSKTSVGVTRRRRKWFGFWRGLLRGRGKK
ncbi:uncharacterized protein EV422DRAFT_305383 [Fimicolochytrium jonesii]|uniref:uncharacterized protein n=1 Tax=Fimicolochytrium jonesii TaxID=1396493 RepID=UPI0022FE3235|nr:uncharacterized protein EV422DRAFT_305383 [Fimicolochytrium jonesii]KAI8824060.1 hypothetical protein EV422DRAFT_305383 [Fimicolochytrium jonesii]